MGNEKLTPNTIKNDVCFLKHFLMKTLEKFECAKRYIYIEGVSDKDFIKMNSDLVEIDSGGFSHASVGGMYGMQQLDREAITTRSTGYLTIANLLQRNIKWSQSSVLLDVLAGNGTFDRVLEVLRIERPLYVGNDISITMVKQAQDDNRLVFYSNLHSKILGYQFADYGVSAYGTHHIPVNQRQGFIKAASCRLKTGATFVIQDFIEGSTTARWYSELIDKLRPGGHRFKHFIDYELTELLRENFKNVDESYIYDPFILKLPAEYEDDQAKSVFYNYLISLFALSHLKSKESEGRVSVDEFDKLFLSYFRVSEYQLSKCISQCKDEWFETELSIKKVDGEKYLIAPRVAIAAVGEKK